MMHNFPLEYSELWLASSSLNTRQSKLLIDLLARYTQASAVNPDATLPETDDLKVGAVLYPICMRIQACTVAHAKRSKTNKKNADTRWSKAKGKGEGMAEGAAPAPKAKGKGKAKEQPEAAVAVPDKPKAEAAAPLTLDEFVDFCGNMNINDVRGLYDKLQKTGWIYHGHQLSEYWTKCNACYAKGQGKWCCGMFAVVVFNTLRGYKEPLRAAAFNAACDVMAAAGRGLCDVGKVMSDTHTSEADGEIRHGGKTFNSVQNFAEFLNNSLRKQD
jgi:hypothetical protein